MSPNNTNLLKVFLVVFALGSIFIIGNLEHNAYKRKILTNPVLATGTISEVEYKGKSGYVVSYSFEVDHRFISSYVNGARFGRLRNIIKGKSFPVIFNGNAPEYNRMLIHPKDFKEYNIVFPDSLLWINKYIN